MKKKSENIFPILDTNILDCGFSPLIKNACKKINVETILELLQKVQNKEAADVFAQRSWREIQDKIKNHCGLILDKSSKLTSYQKIILSKPILAN